MNRTRIALVLAGVAVISGGVIARNAVRKPRVRVEIQAPHGPVARSTSSSATGGPLAAAASHEARWSDPAAPGTAEPEPIRCHRQSSTATRSSAS